MLLEPSKDAPDFSKKLFENSLPNAHFDGDLPINMSWSQDSGIQPLFVATQTAHMESKVVNIFCTFLIHFS